MIANTEPIIIISSGIIQWSISINVIIINNDIKTKKLIVAMSIKYLLYTSKNNIPVNNSTKAYLLDIFILQYLHFFPDNKQLSIGTKSLGFYLVLQFGQ